MGDTGGPVAGGACSAVSLEQLLLAFSWAADEAGYDLDATNSLALLLLRAWRTVETGGAWKQPARPPAPPTPRVVDQVTEIIPVVVGAPAP
jgi:hypothetical protein